MAPAPGPQEPLYISGLKQPFIQTPASGGCVVDSECTPGLCLPLREEGKVGLQHWSKVDSLAETQED
jgi:exosome complex RNA-binding protein Rrp42 (RNase PH superfamily)